ncbi:Oxidoreductase OXR1 [Colletotrichum sp. SAR 10_70]|nr:Oxidoreductase OXR1 [Colletotrichum sp. SAR 10_71]KAI8173775.1 Oxidoreductase OXR1 [Colletotrichum sp. SAR 10_70]KAJ4995581.1 Oxidoreductase OXR1 [Colletotrichum sp. SAR 10_66]
MTAPHIAVTPSGRSGGRSCRSPTSPQASFPPGVFNLISGFGKVAGAAISSHMNRVDPIKRTPSTDFVPAAAKDEEGYVLIHPNLVFFSDIPNAEDHIAVGDIAIHVPAAAVPLLPL